MRHNEGQRYRQTRRQKPKSEEVVTDQVTHTGSATEEYQFNGAGVTCRDKSKAVKAENTWRNDTCVSLPTSSYVSVENPH